MNQDVRKAKQEVVDKFVALAKSNTTIVIAEYRGLSVAKAQELRRALRAQGAQMFVFKNSLVERAAKELGYEGLDEYLSGPNAFFFSEDLSAGAKIVSKYAKRFGDSLKIKGGIVEGKAIDAAGVKEVANMPGREGLLAMFLSCLQAPVRQFACAVKAVADAK